MKNKKLITKVYCDWWEELTEYQSHINDNGKKTLEKWLREFSPTLIKEAMTISLEKITKDKNGKYDETDLEKAFSSIGGICYNKSQNPLKSKKTHLINLIKKIHGDKEMELVEMVVENLFKELLPIKTIELQIAIIDQMIFPIVKSSESILECLYDIETFIDEKLVK